MTTQLKSFLSKLSFHFKSLPSYLLTELEQDVHNLTLKCLFLKIKYFIYLDKNLPIADHFPVFLITPKFYIHDECRYFKVFAMSEITGII